MAFRLNRRRRFGLLCYRDTLNLGDEIQSLAARAFLPRVDRLLDRDDLSRAPGWAGETALICNGWFSHRPERWPPHPRLRPLLVSMHLSDQVGPEGFSAAEAWVVGRSAAYLREHGPVGARDLWTLDLLQRNEIDSYFSGCLTLTLRRPDLPRGEAVIASDLDPLTLSALRARTRAPVMEVTHEVARSVSAAKRMALAEELLDIYARARCVVTTRLHAALPCLAMGTPVLLLPPRPNMIRLWGLQGFVHHSTAEEFSRGGDYRPDCPPPNPASHVPFAEALRSRCERFIAAASAQR